jgi:hypothetical protein
MTIITTSSFDLLSKLLNNSVIDYIENNQGMQLLFMIKYRRELQKVIIHSESIFRNMI